jgi:hypothetical protein
MKDGRGRVTFGPEEYEDLLELLFFLSFHYCMCYYYSAEPLPERRDSSPTAGSNGASVTVLSGTNWCCIKHGRAPPQRRYCTTRCDEGEMASHWGARGG